MFFLCPNRRCFYLFSVTALAEVDVGDSFVVFHFKAEDIPFLDYKIITEGMLLPYITSYLSTGKCAWLQ